MAPAHSTVLASSPAGPLEVILSGGIVGLLIIGLLAVLSLAAVALVVEHLLSIRRSVLIPAGLSDRVRQQLSAGNLPGARQACDAQPSALAVVLRAGLAEVQLGWPQTEKAMEEMLAEESARLLRKIDYLSVIGNIAPMVGLLGTVVGMIFAFQEVANAEGAARAADLASGIYQALVTTVGGLVVAIPALTAYAVFRNRIDGFIAETGYAAQRATAPLKAAVLKSAAGAGTERESNHA